MTASPEATTEAAPRATALGRRRRMVLGVALAATMVSGGGLAAATFVESPSQAAADARPPKASVITAPVRREVLTSTIVLRGTFSDGRTISASPTSVAATASNDASSGAALVVTGVFVHPGQQIAAGRALVEYSGRPVFALPGSLPMYRDLRPGDTGKDVAQLQAALRSLGDSTYPDHSGTFGAGTRSALARMYAHMGYAVPVTGTATQAAITTAQQRLDTLTAPPPAGASVGQGTSSQASGTRSLAAQLSQARTDLAKAKAADGAMLPASEVVFVPSLPARVASVPVSVGDAVKGPVVTLARGGMELTGALDPSDAGLVKPGMLATVLSETTGTQQSAVVDSIGALTTATSSDKTGDGSSGGQSASVNGGAAYLPLSLHSDHLWDPRFAGQDVRITLTAASTQSAVLAVPDAAISTGADMHTTVTVAGTAGGERVITVQTGASADGMVQVTPVGGSLTAGDEVVVGQ